MDDFRGGSRIQNSEKARQLIDFRGLQVEHMYPTDIDGIFEIKDKSYIIFEIKHGDAEVPVGQKILLTRMINDFSKAGKSSIAIVGEHMVHNPNKNIDAALCRVRELYTCSTGWYKPTKNITLQEAIDTFCDLLKRKEARPTS